jgi:multiple sugar transport system permease protein
MLIIFTMMLPLQVTMIPVFIINNQLGWLNTIYPLIVPAYLGGGAFNIFLFRQFFLNIPREIIDAAKMDGLSHLQIYYKIVLPMAKPVVTAVCILTFLFTWNDFMGPLIYLSDQIKGTLALGLMLFVGQYQTEWGQLMALSIIMILPVFLIFIAFQKHFISGLMFGGSKT